MRFSKRKTMWMKFRKLFLQIRKTSCSQGKMSLVSPILIIKHSPLKWRRNVTKIIGEWNFSTCHTNCLETTPICSIKPNLSYKFPRKIFSSIENDFRPVMILMKDRKRMMATTSKFINSGMLNSIVQMNHNSLKPKNNLMMSP